MKPKKVGQDLAFVGFWFTNLCCTKPSPRSGESPSPTGHSLRVTFRMLGMARTVK